MTELVCGEDPEFSERVSAGQLDELGRPVVAAGGALCRFLTVDGGMSDNRGPAPERTTHPA